MSHLISLLFPGQGAQEVGMGQALYEKGGVGADVYDYADQILEKPLSSICFEGPEDRLTATRNSQPAILVTSIAHFVDRLVEMDEGELPNLRDMLEGRLMENIDFPDQFAVAAGLSLGEYTALVAAGTLTFRDGLELVNIRANAMQDACERVESGMRSVMGFDRSGLEAICHQVNASNEGVICISNVNSPEQFVVSGTIPELDRVEELAKEQGAKRVIPLDVAGAFHSPLMEPAEARLNEALERTELHEPFIPVVANVNGKTVEEPEQIRSLLSKQLTSPVLWEDSMRTIREKDVEEFWEIGPGRSLAGLMARIDRSALRQFHQIPE